MDRISRIKRITLIRLGVMLLAAICFVVGTLLETVNGPTLLAISHYYWLGIILLLSIATGSVFGQFTGKSKDWPEWWSEVPIWIAVVFFSGLYALTSDRMAWLNIVGWLFFWAMRWVRAERRVISRTHRPAEQ